MKVRYIHLRYPSSDLKVCSDGTVAPQYMTYDPALVTCPRCKRLVERMQARVTA